LSPFLIAFIILGVRATQASLMHARRLLLTAAYVLLCCVALYMRVRACVSKGVHHRDLQEALLCTPVALNQLNTNRISPTESSRSQRRELCLTPTCKVQ
jgi:ABC-type nickel/cobalt efflux system permease component RcnA